MQTTPFSDLDKPFVTGQRVQDVLQKDHVVGTDIRLRGIGASPGIVIGRAYHVDRGDMKIIYQYLLTANQVDKELRRFEEAVERTRAPCASGTTASGPAGTGRPAPPPRRRAWAPPRRWQRDAARSGCVHSWSAL